MLTFGTAILFSYRQQIAVLQNACKRDASFDQYEARFTRIGLQPGRRSESSERPFKTVALSVHPTIK
jgi:hypothetical protein